MASSTIVVRMCEATRQPTTAREVSVGDEADVGDADPGWHERQVGYPQLIGSVGSEVAADQVRVAGHTLLRSGCAVLVVRRTPSIPVVRISRATWSRPTSCPARWAAFQIFRAP